MWSPTTLGKLPEPLSTQHKVPSHMHSFCSFSCVIVPHHSLGHLSPIMPALYSLYLPLICSLMTQVLFSCSGMLFLCPQKAPSCLPRDVEDHVSMRTSSGKVDVLPMNTVIMS